MQSILRIRNFSILRACTLGHSGCFKATPPSPHAFGTSSACAISLPPGSGHSVLARVAQHSHQRSFPRWPMACTSIDKWHSQGRGQSCPINKCDSAIYCQRKVTSSGKWSLHLRGGIAVTCLKTLELGPTWPVWAGYLAEEPPCLKPTALSNTFLALQELLIPKHLPVLYKCEFFHFIGGEMSYKHCWVGQNQGLRSLLGWLCQVYSGVLCF